MLILYAISTFKTVSRGNKYSNRNVKWTTDEPEFWNWTFEEMAFLDLPPVLDYINRVTKSKVDYIGLFTKSAVNTEYCCELKKTILIGMHEEMGINPIAMTH